MAFGSWVTTDTLLKVVERLIPVSGGFQRTCALEWSLPLLCSGSEDGQWYRTDHRRPAAPMILGDHSLAPLTASSHNVCRGNPTTRKILQLIVWILLCYKAKLPKIRIENRRKKNAGVNKRQDSLYDPTSYQPNWRVTSRPPSSRARARRTPRSHVYHPVPRTL